MAATAMDPVDIANILAQELLYQQVTLHVCFRAFTFLQHTFFFPSSPDIMIQGFETSGKVSAVVCEPGINF